MNAPICPTHGTPLINKGKGWFCPKKVGDAWCPYKPGKEAPQASTVAPQTTPAHLLALGCLDAASRVYQGTGDASGFLDLANQLLMQHGSQS